MKLGLSSSIKKQMRAIRETRNATRSAISLVWLLATKHDIKIQAVTRFMQFWEISTWTLLTNASERRKNEAQVNGGSSSESLKVHGARA